MGLLPVYIVEWKGQIVEYVCNKLHYCLYVFILKRKIYVAFTCTEYLWNEV